MDLFVADIIFNMRVFLVRAGIFVNYSSFQIAKYSIIAHKSLSRAPRGILSLICAFKL